MKTRFLAFLVLVASVTITKTSSAATNHDFSLKSAQQVTFSENTLNGAKSTNKRLSFLAFGKNFKLVLDENNALMPTFSSRRTDIKLYAGEIDGNSKSWARITVVNGQYSGAVFDGQELYLLDVGENVNAALINKNSMQAAATVVYRASDASTDASCGTHDNHESSFSYENLTTQSNDNTNSDLETAEATASQKISLRIVADTQYAASGPDAEAQVISQMNIVNGIFSEQVDVEFEISEIEVLSNNGTLTSTNASELLNQFRTFTGTNNPGLAHLFTGRDIDGGTIGIAFLRAICRNTGVGLTQAGGRGSLGALTAAHEFGHNFGAPHDNQSGSVCASTPGTFLMNPSLNRSDEFSQCSLDQIAPVVASAQCLSPVEPAPEPEPEPNPIAPASSCEFAVDFSTGSNDFEFIPNPPANPGAPSYSSNSVSGGSINTTLGGVDSENINNIESVWSRDCISRSTRNIELQVTASLTQSSEYEADEFSQIALRVNGATSLLDTITGDGNGGPSRTTGTQRYTANVALNSGVNTVELVCFNNLKTQIEETTECRFNSLRFGDGDIGGDNPGDGSEDLCVVIRAKNSNITTVCL